MAIHCTADVAVIGGGVFGLLTALETAARGHRVIVFEAGPDIGQGATLVNQCRVHMGYHYPRDYETAEATLKASDQFCQTFAAAITHPQNYYCIARQGSRTSATEYLAFCRRLGLPCQESWPTTARLARSKVELSLQVPERSFDPRRLVEILRMRVAAQPRLQVLTAAAVVGLERLTDGYMLAYQWQGEVRRCRCRAVVNATYSATNHIHRLAGLPMAEYQFELCEMPVVRVPWQGATGVAIMDGPFSSLMSMALGDAADYLLYDVDLSVLERSSGYEASPRFDLAYYQDEARCRQRFLAYLEKMSDYYLDVGDFDYIRSHYCMRIVLVGREHDDARPTLLRQPWPGLWSIFSGKIATCVPSAQAIADEADGFLRQAINRMPEFEPFPLG